jgi:hypothetical protein
MAHCDHKFIDSKVCIKCGWSPGEAETWKPNASRVDYACRVIEALCNLWNTDADMQESLRNVAQDKLNLMWLSEHSALAPGHEAICAQVFWDTVVTRYPSNGVYQVQAIWNETLNPENNAQRVVVYVQPATCVERIQLNLNAQGQ